MRINRNNGNKSLQGLKTRTRTRPQGQGPDPQRQGQGPDPQGQDLKYVLKESLRTRINVTAKYACHYMIINCIFLTKLAEQWNLRVPHEKCKYSVSNY